MNYSYNNSESLSLNYLQNYDPVKNEQDYISILLLHEFGDSSKSWEKITKELSGKFNVVQIDFRVSGPSMIGAYDPVEPKASTHGDVHRDRVTAFSG